MCVCVCVWVSVQHLSLFFKKSLKPPRFYSLCDCEQLWRKPGTCFRYATDIATMLAKLINFELKRFVTNAVFCILPPAAVSFSTYSTYFVSISGKWHLSYSFVGLYLNALKTEGWSPTKHSYLLSQPTVLHIPDDPTRYRVGKIRCKEN